jgi:Pretoxin HINT domain
VKLTGAHPFWVQGDTAFVNAAQLEVGDDFRLADGRSAELVDIEIEEAASGSPFKTYNFEVADVHTYFVGADGVWVHNASNVDCQTFLAIVNRMAQRDDSSKREAFEKVLKLSNPKNYTVGTPEYQKAVKRATKFDPHLALAAREVMEEAYTEALTGAVPDLSKVPTTKQLYEALGYKFKTEPWNTAGFWQKGKAKKSALQVHHIAQQAHVKKLFDKLNIPWDQSTMDNMPGFLINTLDGRPGAGPSHNALTQLMDRPIAQMIDNLPAAPTVADVNTVLIAMEGKYRQWDADLGPKIGAVMRQWFRSRGVGS